MGDRSVRAAARGMGSMATIAPPVAPTSARTVGEPTDHQLVAAVRAGDDHAFERLYERYQRRIAAYIYGMVNDYARAEDIAQDVFMSALRRMRETDRPIAFKPWIYEIAKNACIDQFRRSRRAEEVSYDADEGLAPATMAASSRRARRPTSRSTRRCRSTTCAAPSAASPRPTTRSSSCASSRASATARSASGSA